jgi:Domain of unknown function (DUF4342)
MALTIQGGSVRKKWESFRVNGEDLLKRVREIIHEGNVRRIVIKQGSRTVAEFPVNVGLVGAVAAPMLAALGAVAALLTRCTIEVEREAEPSPRAAPRRKKAPKRARRARL